MRDESKPAQLERLTTRLRERTAVIGIIGLGYSVFR
jgi:UDP-N-acetyl-D-glucosamine dehydrogenase